MSKKSSTRFLVVLLSVTLTTAAVVFADLCAFAQDTSGGAAQNANAATPKTSHRAHRSRRRRHRAAAASSAATTATANTGGEQTDLSGTYTGTINCMSMTGDSTLTITGNQFTLSGASSGSGRITAVTTRGYTGATLRFDAAGGGTPTSVSVRAKKSGDKLWLSPVPGEMNKCSFTPGGGSAGGARHGRRGRRRAAAPAATDATMEAPAASDATAAPTTPKPHRTSRRTRRGAKANANSNTGDNTNSNTTPPQL